MRKYEEMVPIQIKQKTLDDRQKWLYSLTIEELREFRRGLNNTQDWIKSWQSYIDSVISHKIAEMRDSKLDDLGL